MAIAANLGYPRIGVHRELKRAVEAYWAGGIDPEELHAVAQGLRRNHWELQRSLGMEHIPSNDFSLYDHVLDAIAMLGAVPKRFPWSDGVVDLPTYFAMARGTSEIAPLDMKKWFGTNYHYIVPELEQGMKFRLASTKPVDHFLEARSLGIHTRPVLLGPVSFLMLGKRKNATCESLALLHDVLPVYEEVLTRLARAGADWVQMDEPILAMDLPREAIEALGVAYARFRSVADRIRICLTTYFGDLHNNLPAALHLPVAAVHLDLVRGPAQLESALEMTPPGTMLSLGVVDGRNVWRCNLDNALGMLEKAVNKLGSDRVMAAPSCSLLHCPNDLDEEVSLDAELKTWMAFAKQKLREVALLTKGVNQGRGAIARELEDVRSAFENRSRSARIHNPEVQRRMAGVNNNMLCRRHPFARRREIQRQRLSLPILPTTTIGSFPQTTEVRKARAALKKGEWTQEQYDDFCRREIEKTIRFQEDIGLDVLVHGEFERADMVEYFGEQMDGFAFTQNGWVQSYGTRCVKPPIIFGDVSRPRPMTVRWSQFAQSLTAHPMKGMLTGPITILQWSFVRDDQPRRDTAFQIALAVRDEVTDLEAAKIQVIQIDEAALREGLPLCKARWAEYLSWAVDAFRLASTGVQDETQIHTHMCYSEFNDIIESLAALDADVISVEASRSDMELLDAFVQFKYPNEIGPGVYDIHSPRVPETEEIMGRIRKALKILPADRLWVNPDCGLKTRGWREVHAALRNMVDAAQSLRRTMKL